MKKHKSKLIIGVAVLLIVTIILSLSNKELKKTISQDKKDFYENETCVADDLYDKYTPRIKDNGSDSFTITIGESDSPEDVKSAEFKLISVTGGTLNTDVSSSVIKHGNPLTVSITPTKGNYGEYTVTATVQLTSSSDGCASSNFQANLVIEKQGSAITTSGAKKIANTNFGEGKICNNFRNGIYDANQFSNGKVNIKKSDFDTYNYSKVTAEGQQFYSELLNYCWQDQVIVNYTEEEIGEMISNAIGIWKNYSSPNYSTQSASFTDIKNKAYNSGTYQDNPETLQLNYNLKCNHKIDLNASDYYQNKNYYYAKSSEEAKKVTYTYNYSYGDTATTETKDVCTRTCEEAVMVEYGPPVASKAGLCFEYKVKVTSYVKCDSTINTDAKPKELSYCTPTAICTHNNQTLNQAGPTEEFETCIDKCDGGKYTEKCSKKCYDQVYRKNKTTLNKTTVLKNYNVVPLAYTRYCEDSDGCYYWSGDNIKWQHPTEGTNVFGRWYYLTGYCDKWGGDCTKTDETDGRSYFADSDGIRRGQYASGNVCTDVCSWQGCSKGEYLNPTDAANDYAANVRAYNAAVNECKAAASCSTKTAEFTIAIKYDTKDKDGNITVNKIYYPYSTSSVTKNPTENENEYTGINKDKLKAQGGNSLSNESTVLNYNGCYENKDQYNWYQTEWGFPGTYINNKTGEISFEPKPSGGWHKEKSKFCMPLNATSVNSKWWEWTKLGNHCVSEADVLAELNGRTGTSNGYNIEAIAKDFGYFGWNFNIKCFYATRNEQCNLNENKCCNNDSSANKTIGVDNYTVRTIDIDNMFPNSDVSGITNPTVQARKVGFNWTEDASILSIKNEKYAVNPKQLIDDIQTTGNEIYNNDAYLDYQFYLTPSALNKIRQYNKKYDYGVWNGTVDLITDSGINVYSSNLFRNTGVESGLLNNISGAVKKTGTVGKNND